MTDQLLQPPPYTTFQEIECQKIKERDSFLVKCGTVIELILLCSFAMAVTFLSIYGLYEMSLPSPKHVYNGTGRLVLHHSTLNNFT